MESSIDSKVSSSSSRYKLNALQSRPHLKAISPFKYAVSNSLDKINLQKNIKSTYLTPIKGKYKSIQQYCDYKNDEKELLKFRNNEITPRDKLLQQEEETIKKQSENEFNNTKCILKKILQKKNSGFNSERTHRFLFGGQSREDNQIKHKIKPIDKSPILPLFTENEMISQSQKQQIYVRSSRKNINFLKKFNNSDLNIIFSSSNNNKQRQHSTQKTENQQLDSQELELKLNLQKNNTIKKRKNKSQIKKNKIRNAEPKFESIAIQTQKIKTNNKIQSNIINEKITTKKQQIPEIHKHFKNLSNEIQKQEFAIQVETINLRQKDQSKINNTYFVSLINNELNQKSMIRSKIKKDNQKSLLTSRSNKIISKQQLPKFMENYKSLDASFNLKELVKKPNFQIMRFKNGIYLGQMRNEKRQGLGLFISDKSLFQGEFKNGFKHKGTQSMPQGIYKGEFLNGLRQGKGQFNWINEESYIGQWKCGMKHGKGLWKSKNGDYYDGQWINNRQQGVGIHMHKGNVYQGQFINFLKQGKGKQKFLNGDTYEGEYKQGKPYGKGIYIWKNGSKYEGQFKNGLRNGIGVMQQAGTIYTAVQVNLKMIQKTDQVKQFIKTDQFLKAHLKTISLQRMENMLLKTETKFSMIIFDYSMIQSFLFQINIQYIQKISSSLLYIQTKLNYMIIEIIMKFIQLFNQYQKTSEYIFSVILYCVYIFLQSFAVS